MERTESIVEGRVSPSPEVLERPVRRRFTVEYKAKILAEADACTEAGQFGELLRREGLYSSHLTTWRRQRDEGVLAGLTPKRRGRKSKAKNPVAEKAARQRAESGEAAFVPITLKASPVEIELPNGGIVRLPLGVGQVVLVEVIRAVGALRPWKAPKS